MLDAFLRDYLAPTGGIHLVAISDDSGVTGRHFGTDYTSAATWAREQNAARRGVYFSVAIIRDGVHTKPGKRDVSYARWAHLDIDPSGPEWDKQAALADLQLRGQPSFICDSGNGIQGFWVLDKHVTGDEVEEINRGLVTAFNADKGTWNSDRVMRLPGLTNWPNAKKQALGRIPVDTGILQAFIGTATSPATLLSRFPAPAVARVEALPQGARAEWTLRDKTDDEILAMALRSRGGMGAMFGDKATFAELWEGSEEMIAKFFPGPSEADAALCSHLSFWWGADPVAIDRMFRRSGLMRPKWDERGGYYANITIGKIVANGGAVYSVPQTSHISEKSSANATQLPGVTVDAPDALNGEVVPGGEFLTIYEQKNHFKGCVYVADLNEVLTPTGAFMKPATFKAMFGGHMFEVGDQCAPTKDAFEALTLNRLYKFPKVLTTMFEPSLPFGTIQDDAVNIYRPDPSVKCVEGDVSPFLNHLALMIPDERDRRILLTWMAALVQNPGAKFQWAPFLQGAQGNGKSMIGQVLKRAVGPHYVHEPFSDDLCNKFNDWQQNKRLIVVEELSLGEKAEMMNNLKTWITADHIEIQAKNVNKKMAPNKANWIIFSNYQNGLVFTTADRRYAIFFTAQQTAEDVIRAGMSGRYFPDLWNWLREGGYAHMTWFLSTYQLDPEFSPIGYGPGAARAPETTSTGAAVTASMGRYEAAIVEAVESGEVGFRGGWISSWVLSKLEKDLGLRLNPLKRKSALESLGYVSWGRSTTIVMAEGSTKPTLYCRRGMEQDTVQMYESKQGYGL